MTSPRAVAPLPAAPWVRNDARDERDLRRALAAIRAHNRRERRWIVVLDDDPTGTQTTQNIPTVLGDWTVDDLNWAAEQDRPACFIQTNSRGLSPSAAEGTVDLAVRTAYQVAEAADRRLTVVTRSDSTLRGHFLTELSAATRALEAVGQAPNGIVFAPAFFEAGRVTSDRVQWATVDGRLVPAAHTEFARDVAFPYDELYLDDWVTNRWDPSQRFRCLYLAAGQRDYEGFELLRAPRDIAIIEARSYVELARAMEAAFHEESEGASFVYRTGPSAIRVLTGQENVQPIRLGRVPRRRDQPGGLIVAGSHTELTNQQLAELQKHYSIEVAEINLTKVLAPDAHERHTEIERVVEQAVQSLAAGLTLIQTTRQMVNHASVPMLTTQRVADAVTEVAAQVVAQTEPRYLVAKGGITSNDIAAKSLSCTRATVLGQAFPGLVPLWRLENGTRPGLLYVVFPGNVGTRDTLTELISRLEDTRKAS